MTMATIYIRIMASQQEISFSWDHIQSINTPFGIVWHEYQILITSVRERKLHALFYLWDSAVFDAQILSGVHSRTALSVPQDTRSVGQKPERTEAPGSKFVKMDKSLLMNFTTRTKNAGWILHANSVRCPQSHSDVYNQLRTADR